MCTHTLRWLGFSSILHQKARSLVQVTWEPSYSSLTAFMLGFISAPPSAPLMLPFCFPALKTRVTSAQTCQAHSVGTTACWASWPLYWPLSHGCICTCKGGITSPSACLAAPPHMVPLVRYSFYSEPRWVAPAPRWPGAGPHIHIWIIQS